MKFKIEKKKLRTIFLHENKLDSKAPEATDNIHKAFGQETSNERIVQRSFQNFEMAIKV